MSTGIELYWILFIKKVGTFIPNRLKFRFYKLLYNYQSHRVKGVKLTVPYYPSLNLRFIVNTKYLIDWNVFFFGYYEKETNDILFEYIKAGDVVLEAGANNGTETVLLSRITGDKGKVYAFEPIAHVYELLTANLNLNACNNVITKQLALGEADKEVFFHTKDIDHCNQGMSSRVESIHSAVSVQQQTIDSWAKQQAIERLDFIKMDIQGAEIDLLKGAEASIKKFKPLIFTEATEDFLSLKALYDRLITYGYDVYAIQNRGIHLLTGRSLSDGNWLAIPTEQTAAN